MFLLLPLFLLRTVVSGPHSTCKNWPKSELAEIEIGRNRKKTWPQSKLIAWGGAKISRMIENLSDPLAKVCGGVKDGSQKFWAQNGLITKKKNLQAVLPKSGAGQNWSETKKTCNKTKLKKKRLHQIKKQNDKIKMKKKIPKMKKWNKTCCLTKILNKCFVFWIPFLFFNFVFF